MTLITLKNKEFYLPVVFYIPEGFAKYYLSHHLIPIVAEVIPSVEKYNVKTTPGVWCTHLV